MFSGKRCFQLVAVMTASMWLLISGCSDDECLTCPKDPGSIVIDQSPDDLAGAGWSLWGPINETGSGDSTLSDIPVGVYTLTWTDVGGYVTPSPDTQTLATAGTLTFSGNYDEVCRTVLIGPGSFQMGSSLAELGHQSDETEHAVTLTQGFYMATCEVTEEMWDDVMSSNSSTSHLPKNDVSWDQAIAFCNALSIVESLTPAYTINGPSGDVTWDQTANGYRLPTEAEWEYACRAGTTTAFANGEITFVLCNDPLLNLIGWYCGNAGGSRHEVGQLVPNSSGLFDMHGNVYEWCWDGYRDDYENLPQMNPVNDVGSGANRLIRGGGWSVNSQFCRSAYRTSSNPAIGNVLIGLRPVRSAF